MTTQKTNVMRRLEQAGISYVGHNREQERQLTPDPLAKRQEQIFKTLVTVGKSGEYYVFMLPITEELDLKKAAAAAGEKNIQMIKERELLPLTGYVHGGCSPIGMKRHLPTFLDETATLWPTIIFSAGQIDLSVEMSPDDLANIIPFQVTDLTPTP